MNQPVFSGLCIRVRKGEGEGNAQSGKNRLVHEAKLGLRLRLGNSSHKWASSFRDSLYIIMRN